MIRFYYKYQIFDHFITPSIRTVIYVIF